MAKEELDPNAGTEVIDAPAAGEIADPNAEQEQPQEPGPVEALASEMGWVPKDQFRGEEVEWKPADEFIKAGRDISRSLKRELKGVREEVSRIARTSADMTAQAVAERDQHWQRIHAKAVEEGDAETANRAVDERIKLKTAPPADSGEPAETQDFKTRHSAWFGKNRLATGRAMEVAERSRQMGATVSEQLEDAEQAVKREFPDLFPKTKAAASVQTGQARNANSGSKKKGFHDMPPESQEMAKDYLKRHGVPLEKTAESYWADKNERKVG